MSLFSQTTCDEARHLLRAILRECTYLPDPCARKYLARHAVDRFGDYAPAAKPESVLQERQPAQIAKARKALSELRRANAGELKPLQKVLHLAYGRAGKRRHELLRPLAYVAPAVTESGTTTQHLPQLTPQHLPQLTPQHRALLVSQTQTRPPTLRTTLRSIALKFPEKNNWERPMPQKRVDNMTRDWYATMLDRTSVPLPRTEWELLRDFSLGTIKFQGPIPRRPLASSQTWNPSPLEFALGVASVRTPQAIVHMNSRPVHGHNLTPRFMRRCWAAVFAQCPVLDWDPTSNTWKTEWGCTVLDQERIKRAIDII